MLDKTTFEETEQNVDAEGQLRTVQIIKSPVFDANGHVAGVQGMFWDVTGQNGSDAQG